ncbi:hypothetical protein ABEB36_005254 [Hypothenemus hampei]
MDNETIDLTDPLQELFIETNFSKRLNSFSRKSTEDVKRGLDIKPNVAMSQSYSNPVVVNFKIQKDKNQFLSEGMLNDDGKLRISVTQEENNLLKVTDIIELSDDDDQACESDVVLEKPSVEIIDVSDDESSAKNNSCKDSYKLNVMNQESDENEILIQNFTEFDYHNGLPINSTYLQPLNDLHETTNLAKQPIKEEFYYNEPITEEIPKDTIENKSTENSNIENIKFEKIDSNKYIQQTNCESTKEDNESKLIERDRKQEEKINTTSLNETDDKRVAVISEEDNFSSQEDNPEISFQNFEEIRKNLKLQLTSLRMGKKGNFLKGLQIPIKDEKLEEKCQNKDLKHLIEGNKNFTITSPISKEFVPPKNFQTTLSIPDKESESKIPVNGDNPTEESNNDDDEIPNVFNEIRKIINKPKIPPRISSDLKPFNFSRSSIHKCDNQSRQLPSTSFQDNNKKSKGIKSDIYQDSTSNSISSPFVSDSLDEFLTDAKLNVSYTIPKSGAEEGLTRNYALDPVVSVNKKIKKEESVKPKEKLYKPKTLAEKRKLLEHSHRIEQKRLEKLKRETKQIRSYVLFKNKQVFVHTNSKAKCIASIESSLTLKTAPQPTVNKPSLLKELQKKTFCLTYKPGPLCKKHLLQSDYSQWKSELKPLPKVEVQVMPQIGQPIHEKLIPYVNQWNWMVSDKQIDFALSALVSGTDLQKKVFTFDLHYEKNQESILTRKKIENTKVEPKILIDDANNFTDSAIKSDVAQIIDNLINYVETQEIAESVIKEDESFNENLLDNVTLPEKMCGNRKRFSGKLSRTSRELKKLNCKMITVDIKSNETEEVCSKPYCKLGCICNSLQCNTLIGLHCRKLKCIFKCLCSNNKSIVNISSSLDTPYLSSDAVSRIEDQAKKNLAKEEKEFTQTVIYANDSAIVVGAANKQRRAAKAPKKYVDFYDDEFLEEESEVTKKTLSVKPCFIRLQNHDFSDIIPYCMNHNLYNCYCKGFSITSISSTSSNPIVIKKSVRTSESTASEGKVIKKPSIEESSEDPAKRRRKRNSALKSDYILYDETDLFPKRKRKEHTDTVVQPSLNFQSNESPVKQSKINRSFNKAINKSFIDISDCVQNEINTTDLKEDSRKTHHRKQQLQVRQEFQLKDKTDPKETQIQSVFPGEIVLNDVEWLRKKCNIPKEFEGCYARILPWTALLKGFISKSIKIYCILDKPLRLVLTTGKVLGGTKVINIETDGYKILKMSLNGTSFKDQSESVKSIVRWLITGNLARKFNLINLSFLLVETHLGEFEVRGLCTQKSPQIEGDENLFETYVSKEEDYIEIKHKDVSNKICSLFVLKKQYPLRELVESGSYDDMQDNLYMWAALPEISKVAKWRVLFMKNDFVYLKFKNIEYSIKYNDLTKLTEMAKTEHCTLQIRNLQISQNHEHADFGIYISPKYSDRIFIGPYLKNYEGQDIDTLKLISQMLVSSEMYSKMKGGSEFHCGYWLYERLYSHTPRVFLKETVDLTKDELMLEGTLKEEPNIQIKNNGVEHLVHRTGFTVLVKNAKPRAPRDFNRYIITNIPHFGYLGAYQPPNSSVLEVSWPFEKKLLEFENAEHARDFLQERFSLLLQPVPVTFKIQVIVLVQLDLEEHKPINSDYLNGQCICGYFGTYNFKTITDEFCREKLNMSKEAITALFAKRAQDYIKTKISELALISGVQSNDTKGYNVDNILFKAREEIKLQEQLRVQHVADIQRYEEEVVENMKKIFKMIKKLPSKYRNIESRILNETLQIRPKRLAVNEVIEIPDDEVENNVQTVNTPQLQTYSKKTRNRKATMVQVQQKKLKKRIKIDQLTNEAAVKDTEAVLTNCEQIEVILDDSN